MTFEREDRLNANVSGLLNEFDFQQIIHAVLNEVARRYGKSYIACMFKPEAFSATGQFNSPQHFIKEKIAADIARSIQERRELVEQHRLQSEIYATENGFITCA